MSLPGRRAPSGIYSTPRLKGARYHLNMPHMVKEYALLSKTKSSRLYFTVAAFK